MVCPSYISSSKSNMTEIGCEHFFTRTFLSSSSLFFFLKIFLLLLLTWENRTYMKSNINPTRVGSKIIISPSKVPCFLWMAVQRCILVNEFLISRCINMDPSSVGCLRCDCLSKAVDHILIVCPWSWTVWSGIYSWLGI